MTFQETLCHGVGRSGGSGGSEGRDTAPGQAPCGRKAAVPSLSRLRALTCRCRCPVVGTLTRNEMVLKRLHLGTVSYGTDTMDEIQSHVRASYPQVGCRPRCARPAHLYVGKPLPLL